jgi:hypothetical protein
VAKDCVVNELSLRDISAPLVLPLVDRLWAVHRLLGPDAVFWIHAAFFGTADFRHLWDAVQRARGDDRARRWLAFQQRLTAFDPSPHVDAKSGHFMASGLGWAHELRGLALSMYSTEWDRAWVEIDLTVLDVVGQTFVERKGERVRHASREAHLGEHDDWTALGDVDRLRVLMKIYGVNHKPASEYKRHVRGIDNDARRERATEPTGSGQYFAHIDGVAVTDAIIAGWERTVLDGVREGNLACSVTRRGPRMYYVFGELPHAVGFAGGTGELTRMLRVEWSGGFVHSHPRLAGAD